MTKDNGDSTSAIIQNIYFDALFQRFAGFYFVIDSVFQVHTVK
jgi:hypothetical protein